MSSKPKVVTSSPVVAQPVRPRSPHSFATRNCVHCGADLPDLTDSVRCPSCRRDSTVTLCEHTHPRESWRITRWHRRPESPAARRAKDVVAVAVGDVTVFLGRFRDSIELRAEDGTRLPIQRVRAIEPGTEVVERMTHIGTCYRCHAAFFLPDCEVQSSGPPRVLRVPVDRPTRRYMRPEPEPSRISAAYLALGTQPQGDDL